MEIANLFMAFVLFDQLSTYYLSSISKLEVLIGNWKLTENEINTVYLPAGTYTAEATVTVYYLIDALQFTIKTAKHGVKNICNKQFRTVHTGHYQLITILCVFTITSDDNMDTLMFFVRLNDARMNEVAAIIETIKVHWSLSNEKPIIFSQTVRLECAVHGVHLIQPYVNRIWTVNGEQIFDGDHRTQNKKYQSCFSSSNRFSLCIHNFTEHDLDLNYRCAYGFHSYFSKISLHNKNYIYSTTSLKEHLSLKIEQEKLKFTMVFDKVYPIPRCFLSEYDKGKYSFVVEHQTKVGYFYEVVLSVVVSHTHQCPRMFSLQCDIGSEEIEDNYRFKSCTYYPTARERDYSLKEYDKTLEIKIGYTKIYPEPACYLSLDNHMKNYSMSRITSDGLYYNAIFEFNEDITPSMCNRPYNVTCCAGQFTDEKNEVIKCKENAASAKMPGLFLVILCSLIALDIGLFY